MGATDFITNPYPGQTADEAFTAARDEALHEYGHAPYSGTISEKDDFTFLRREPVAMKDAFALAEAALRDGEGEYGDKHGPAGAIPVVMPTRVVTVTVDTVVVPTGRFGTDADALSEAALVEVRRRRLIRRGERVQSAEKQQYSYDPICRGAATATLRDVKMLVTLSKPKSHLTRAAIAKATADAWVFFGYAPS